MTCRQVGRELGVRYLAGRRRAQVGQRLRITAQLVEAETGAHLWADKFDGGLEDVFDLQDRITDESRAASSNQACRRSEIERARQKRPDNLNAYDLYLRALPHTARQMPEDAETAIKLLDEGAQSRSELRGCSRTHRVVPRDGVSREPASTKSTGRKGLSHARSVIVSSTDDAAALAIAGFRHHSLERRYVRRRRTLSNAPWRSTHRARQRFI